MALNYDYITGMMNKKYLKKAEDNIFREDHYIQAKMMDNAKVFSGRKVVVPIEYKSSANVGFTAEGGSFTPETTDEFTAAEYTPKMLTTHVTITKEDELRMNDSSARIVENIIKAKVDNAIKSADAFIAAHIWSRTGATATQWNNFTDLIASSGTVGGIAPADFAGWVSPVVNLGGTSYTGDPTDEADLTDPGSDVYLKKTLAMLAAKSKWRGGKNKVFVLPQYLWDLLESILDPQKTGSKMNVMAGKMGFTALDFRGIPVIADDDMVDAQSGDSDGRAYLLNLDHLYFYFNKGAKMTAGKFIEPRDRNAMTSKILTYGQMVISNRASSAYAYGMKSPQAYIQ
jgi:hypothetical protein